jgi:hypothetical protein
MGIKAGHFFFVFFLFSFFFPQNPKKFSTKKRQTNQQSLHPHKLLHDTRSQSLSDFYNCRCIEFAAPTHVQIFATNLLQQRSVSLLHLLLVPLS